jgi:glutaredoxin
VKEYLSQKGIPFVSKDVHQDEAARHRLVNELGSRSTPTLEIGDKVLVGFNPEAIQAALAEQTV